MQQSTDKVIDHYNQISQPLIRMFFNATELQKDYVNAFQSQWVDYMKTTVENYLTFQDKMILLYIQNCNAYLKSAFDLKIKEQQQQQNR